MRGLGQIAELCAVARPTAALVTSIGPGAPRARRNGRGRRPRERRGDRSPPAGRASRSSPPASRCSNPFSAGTTSTSVGSTPAASARRRRRWIASEVRRRDALDVPRGRDRARARAAVHAAAPGRERPRGAHGVRRARAAARAGRGRVRLAISPEPLAGRGARASGRRPRRQRRLQREPDVDAGRARRPRRAGRGAAARRDPRPRWPSSGDESARLPRRDRGRCSDELGIELVVAVGEDARDYLAARRRTASPSPMQAPSLEIADLLRPGDAILVKGSRAVGLEGIPALIEKHSRAW